MKLFTLEEAEALLPRLRDELSSMRASKDQLDLLRGELAHVAQSSTGNGHVKDEDSVGRKRRKAEALVEQINECLTRINGWGVELKGIDEGLFDFPSEREGHTVYLCWKDGEDAIGWWHELDAGFAGRKPL